jgi:signal transduction histidine kinase
MTEQRVRAGAAPLWRTAAHRPRALRSHWRLRACRVRRASRERLRWAVRIRGAVIGLFLAVALAAWWADLLPSPVPVVVAAGAGTVMNLAAAWCVRRWRGIRAMIAWSGVGDLLIITYVVAATGGTASPLVFLYALQVATTALVVDLAMAAAAGTLGVALLAAVTLGLAPFSGGAAASANAAARLTWLLSLGSTLLLLTFIVGYLARRLVRRERELAGAHRRLGRSMRRLAHAHAELQEAYARLARAEGELAAAEKARALGVLVAGVAHELGNPLAVLAGNLEPLEEACAGDDEAPALLASCREAVQRAVALLAELRSFGRGSRGPVHRLAALRPGLESTLALVRHRLPAGVLVRTSYEDVPDVACVAAELNQVFLNLLLNAADALGPGGTLWLTLRRVGEEVQVVVRDDGAGIAPADLPRLFEPFFTTKEVGAGRGLGLAISHAIVERHGGRLEATTPREGGAAFVVHLPIPAVEEPAAGAAEAAPAGGDDARH